MLTQMESERARARALSKLPIKLASSGQHLNSERTQQTNSGLGYFQVGLFVAIILFSIALIKFVCKKLIKFRRSGRRSDTDNDYYDSMSERCDDEQDDHSMARANVATRFARASSKKLAKMWNQRPHCGSSTVGSYSSFFSQLANCEKDLQSIVVANKKECDSFSVRDDLHCLTSTAYASDSNTNKSKLKQANSAPLEQANQDSQSMLSLDSEQSASAKSLTNLANRLSAMLQKHSWSRESSLIVRPTKTTSDSIDDSLDLVQSGHTHSLDTNKEKCWPNKEQDSDSLSSQCRSSRSYIKSLVDVLSSARNQLPNEHNFLSSKTNEKKSNKLSSGNNDSDLDDDDEQDHKEPLEEAQIGSGPGDTMLAQMDISAAHLILSYMEKHMEDKERLRREWDELTASTITFDNTKLNRLLVEKRAQVALSPENKLKNRSLTIVPFDRNRVKLSGRAGSDYINASFIYDDKPRQATHIISQAPLETTLAQFWQVSNLMQIFPLEPTHLI